MTVTVFLKSYIIAFLLIFLRSQWMLLPDTVVWPGHMTPHVRYSYIQYRFQVDRHFGSGERENPLLHSCNITNHYRQHIEVTTSSLIFSVSFFRGRGHSISCYGLLVTSALERSLRLHASDDGFLRFCPSATPANLMVGWCSTSYITLSMIERNMCPTSP